MSILTIGRKGSICLLLTVVLDCIVLQVYTVEKQLGLRERDETILSNTQK